MQMKQMNCQIASSLKNMTKQNFENMEKASQISIGKGPVTKNITAGIRAKKLLKIPIQQV
jgi:hypothetical protein